MERKDPRRERELWLQTPDGRLGERISNHLAEFADDFRDTFLPNDDLGYGFVVDMPGCEMFGLKIEEEVAKYHHYDGQAYHFYDNLLALVHISRMPTIGQGEERVSGKDHVNKNLVELTQEFDKFLKSEAFKHAFDLKIDMKNKTFTIANLNLDAVEAKRFWDNGVKIPTEINDLPQF